MDIFINFCRTIGKLFQSKTMAEAKSFMIRDVSSDDLKAIEAYIKKHNLAVTASYEPNDGHNPLKDKQGKPYPPSIFVNFDKVDVTGWE